VAIAKAGGLRSRSPSGHKTYFDVGVTEIGVGRDKIGYFRWGGFFQKLFACTEAWQPQNESELRSVLREAGDLVRSLIDLYVVPLVKGPAVRVTPFISEIEFGENDQLDFGIEE
jgi:hypothetical protein